MSLVDFMRTDDNHKSLKSTTENDALVSQLQQKNLIINNISFQNMLYFHNIGFFLKLLIFVIKCLSFRHNIHIFSSKWSMEEYC